MRVMLRHPNHATKHGPFAGRQTAVRRRHGPLSRHRHSRSDTCNAAPLDTLPTGGTRTNNGCNTPER